MSTSRPQFAGIVLATVATVLGGCGGGEEAQTQQLSAPRYADVNSGNGRTVAIETYNTLVFLHSLSQLPELVAFLAGSPQPWLNDAERSAGPRASVSRTAIIEAQCGEGGAIDAIWDDTLPEEAINSNDTMEMQWRGCNAGGAVRDGGMRIQVKQVQAAAVKLTTTLAGFAEKQGDNQRRVEGEFVLSATRNTASNSVSFSSAELVVETGIAKYTLANLHSSQTRVGETSITRAAFTLPAFGGDSTVTVSPSFERAANDACPTFGTLKITDANGDTVTLDANTGDASTLLLTVEAGIATTSSVLPCDALASEG